MQIRRAGRQITVAFIMLWAAAAVTKAVRSQSIPQECQLVRASAVNPDAKDFGRAGHLACIPGPSARQEPARVSSAIRSTDSRRTTAPPTHDRPRLALFFPGTGLLPEL